MLGRSQVEKRLKDNTIIDPNTGCYLWVGYMVENGYGQTSLNYHCYKVHRLSAHIFLGLDLSSNLFVLHKTSCPNKNCWNPEHLYIGTQSDNMKDRVELGNHPKGFKNHLRELKTHCPSGHEYTPENTYTYLGSRTCRICRNHHRAKSREKKKAEIKMGY
jgi:hypothetical protein